MTAPIAFSANPGNHCRSAWAARNWHHQLMIERGWTGRLHHWGMAAVALFASLATTVVAAMVASTAVDNFGVDVLVEYRLPHLIPAGILAAALFTLSVRLWLQAETSDTAETVWLIVAYIVATMAVPIGVVVQLLGPMLFHSDFLERRGVYVWPVAGLVAAAAVVVCGWQLRSCPRERRQMLVWLMSATCLAIASMAAMVLSYAVFVVPLTCCPW